MRIHSVDDSEMNAIEEVSTLQALPEAAMRVRNPTTIRPGGDYLWGQARSSWSGGGVGTP